MKNTTIKKFYISEYIEKTNQWATVDATTEDHKYIAIFETKAQALHYAQSLEKDNKRRELNKIKDTIKNHIEILRFENDDTKRQKTAKYIQNLFDKHFAVVYESYIGSHPTQNYAVQYKQPHLYNEFQEVYNSTPPTEF